MRQPERNIANELRHFEPEVDSAHMDQNWEKIKFFLPQEEKKRRFFYLFFNGAALKISIALVFLALGLLSFFYLRQTRTEEQGQSRFNRKVIHKTSLRKSKGESSVPVLKASLKPESKLGNAKGKFQASSGGKVWMRSPKKQASALLPNDNQKQAEKAKGFVSVTKRTKRNEAGEFILTDSKGLSETEVLSETYLQLAPVSIKALPFGKQADSLCILPSFGEEIRSKPGIRNKIGVELLGGWNRSNTLWHPENTVNEQEQKRSGFFGSAALIYSLKNRWNLNLGYSFIQNKSDFGYETNGNKVVATETAVVTVTSFVPDTVYKYFRTSSNTRLTSVGSSFLNLGLGYVLLQQRKFALEILLQLSWRSTLYNVQTQNEMGTDTLLYVRTQGKPALGSQTETENGDQHSRQRFTSYGLTSGFNLVYAINPKTSLLLRPAFFLPVLTNPMHTTQPGFGINQRNWLVGIGIRRYLGR